MSSSHGSQNGSLDIIDDFRLVLRKNTLKGACGRDFIRVEELKKWMRHGNNTGSLLSAVYPSYPHHERPVLAEDITRKGRCALLVFSILLDLGQGAFINNFKRYNCIDHSLPLTKWDLQERYRAIAKLPEYRHIIDGKDAETLEEEFTAKQYAFCPITFDYQGGMDHPPNKILPVLKPHLTPINEKGGTASVWQISVLEEFVDNELREQIASSKYENSSDGLGSRYRFALKRFQPKNHEFYKREREAFRVLSAKKGMIHYLGEFFHVDEEGKEVYNILLEYGQLDLDEYFYDPKILPPVMPQEISDFWRDLFDVVLCVKNIHNFKVEQENISHQYYGWHADIKPDNILIVNGKFKLADPGFAIFTEVDGLKKIKEREEISTVHLGGTITYGAPECSLGIRRKALVTRAIDIWSLGCVFSETATWVILGQEGIAQFSSLRKQAIDKLIANRNPGQTPDQTPAIVSGDYFHDGVHLLPIVSQWHDHLRNCIRRSDKTSAKVLDLIDQKMLRDAPEERGSASDLYIALQKLVNGDKTDSTDPKQEAFRAALREMEASIPSPNTNSQPVPNSVSQTLRKPAGDVLSADMKKSRKAQKLSSPLGWTTHRSDALRSTKAHPKAPTIQEEPSQGNTERLVPLLTISEPEVSPGASSIGHRSQSSGKVAARTSQIIQQGASAPEVGSKSMLDDNRLTRPMTHPQATRRLSYLQERKMQNVFQARYELDSQKSAFQIRPKKNPYLTQFFGQRDLHFLVDDGESMWDLWPEALFLFRVLVEMAVGQDEDGMDLSFTNDSQGIYGKKRPKDFVERMEKSRPSRGCGKRTDIRKKLDPILKQYLSDIRKEYARSKNSRAPASVRGLVVVILTDGRWEGMQDKHAVGKMIANFAKDVEAIDIEVLRERKVSFQFVQFGEDEDARLRLRRLDDQLQFDEAIPDIIDTTGSRGDVHKMLLGSFVEDYDRSDSIS